MKIAVVGTGYVGLVTGAGFADFGHDVTCVDIDERRIAMLRRNEVPFHEPGLPELVRRNVTHGRLRFTTELADAVPDSIAVFIAVGTPSRDDGSAELGYVFEAARQIAQRLNGFTIIVTKSTVPVGTADQLKAIVAAETSHPFAIASNPEFLKEGDAVNDFLRPSRVIVGAEDPRAVDVIRELYRAVIRTADRIQVMNTRSAELTKYASNAMLATRISFVNELARLAEVVGADIEAIRKGIGADPRIGPSFLFAGAGYGGSCLIGSETVLVRQAGEVRLVKLQTMVSAPPSDGSACERPRDLEVLAWRGDRDQPSFMPVSAITRRLYEGELCEIRTKMGRRVICTPDHPFVVECDGRWSVIEASALSEQHWLPVVRGPISNPVVSAEAFDVLGDLLAAGISPEQVIVRIGERLRETECTEALRAVVRDRHRLADIRRTGSLRLSEALAAELDLTGATLGTTRNGTYIPAVLPNSAAFWRVLGLYCAEGWISCDLGRAGAKRMRIAWALHPRDEEHLVDELHRFWTEHGIEPGIFSAPTSRKVSISSRLLATWLLEVLGVGANCYEQRVPDALWSTPESHKRAFLSGLWQGDGSWSHVANRRGIVWEYGTASPQMADGVLRLLSELGIIASWKIGRPPGSTVPTHFIRVSGADQVEQLVDFCHPGERDRIERSIASQHKRIAPTGYRCDGGTRVRVVSSTRRQFAGCVYSLEVPGAETIVTTAGLVVHNCFPKDLRALLSTASEHDVPLQVVTAVDRANERQKRVLGEKILRYFHGKLDGKRIGIWGLAFKPGTDDIREATALTLIEQLRAARATVAAYDPQAMANVRAAVGDAVELARDPYDAADGADALVLVTEWPELRQPALDRLHRLMRTPVLFDGRNVWPREEARKAGFTYFGIGRP